MHGFVRFSLQLPPWEQAYNLWAEWLWGFTKLSITSFVVAVGLAILAYRGRRGRPAFFGPYAFLPAPRGRTRSSRTSRRTGST